MYQIWHEILSWIAHEIYRTSISTGTVDCAGDIVKVCHMKHLERLFLWAPDLTGYIVKECHMKYLKRLSQKVPD
jgi:hypothetical protein